MDRGDPSVSDTTQTLHQLDESQTASSLDEYTFAPRSSRHDALIQNVQALPLSAGPGLLSPYTSEFNFATFGSPIDMNIDQSSIEDATSTPSNIMTAAQRASVGSVGDDFPGPDSVGVSESWSPNSSREHQQPTDEQSSDQIGDKKKNTKSETQEDDKPPAWSELKTKAGKERKRLPLACIACRRKKIRCSGEKPACKHCLRSRIPCVYKVTTRKAAPRTDYMAMLDKRLKRMEERVIKVIPKDELPDMSVVGRAVVRPALPTQTPKASRPSFSKKRSADEAFTTELDDWTKTKGEANLAETVLRSKQAKSTEENSILTEGAEHLPPLELQEHLAEVFFDCIYGQSYLLLHKPSFMRKLKAGTVPPVLILAVCAVAARFSTHPEVNTEPAFLRGDAWASPARVIVESRHFEPNITILISMLILGLHYFGTCEGGLSWSFCGQAMRMAYALQLHRELDYDPLGRKKDKASELTFTDREIRRRTMWACVLMDRFNSSGTERPPFGNEEYIHIQLPIKESHFQMEIPGPTEDLDGGVPNPVTPGNGQVSDPKANMGVAAYVIRAIVLWGRIVKYLNLGGKEKDKYPCWSPQSEFSALQHQVQEFNESLPPLLAYTQENLQNHAAERIANQFLYLHIICQQNILFLNRFAIPISPGARPPRDIPKDFLNECGKLVVRAADQISKLIESAAGHLFTVPFAGYCAYVASTVHVWGIFSKQPQLESASKENLRHNYRYLNKMKKYWGLFHYMAESVKDIYRTFADAALRGSSNSGSSSTHPMVQYGDWFDKYPHGVSGTDWDESQGEIGKEQGAEAVMSHHSELRSVEEFFASLSPPSKSDQPRKAARRSTKGAGESSRAKKQAGKNESSPSHPLATFTQPGNESTTSQASDVTPSITIPEQQPFQPDQPMQSFQSPQSGYNPNNGPYNQQFFPTNHLPHLDRQLVFGAYAGLDLSNNNNNSSNLNSFNQGFWEGVDLNGMNPNSNPGYFGLNNESSSAWFMPFNMEPPEIGNDNVHNVFADAGLGMGFTGPGSLSSQGGQPGPNPVQEMIDLDMGMADGQDRLNG